MHDNFVNFCVFFASKKIIIKYGIITLLQYPVTLTPISPTILLTVSPI